MLNRLTRLTTTDLQRQLASEGIVTKRQTITQTITRWKETGSVKDRPRSGRPKLIPELHYRYIDKKMSENDELTAGSLMDLLLDRFGRHAVLYSVRPLARAREQLGWTYTTARYCQAIREANQAKRLEWRMKRLEEKEDFDDVIFTYRNNLCRYFNSIFIALHKR